MRKQSSSWRRRRGRWRGGRRPAAVPVVMLDDGQVEWPDGGGGSGGGRSDRRDRLSHPAAEAAHCQPHCPGSYPATSSSSAAAGFLLGAGRRHEPVTAREFRVVRLLVRLEYGGPGKRFAAQRAPERSFARVHATVVLHVMPQLERFTAELALKRPVAGVRGQVAHQRGHVRKRFAAKLAQRAAPAVVHRRPDHVVVALGRQRQAVRRQRRRRERRRGLLQRHDDAAAGIRKRRAPAARRIFQAVRQYVPGEFALVRERKLTVHARVVPQWQRGRISRRSAVALL